MTQPAYADASWPAAGTKSDPVSIPGAQVVGFVTPGTLSGTAFTFEMATDINTPTWVPVKDSSGNAISFTVAASGYYGFSENQIAAFRGIQHLKVVSGSSESAGRLVKLATREV